MKAMEMELKNIKNVYFLGIGGIGMSAIARYFVAQGATVSGYDKTPTVLTDELMKEGIAIDFNDTDASLPKVLDLVVYTPAIPSSHRGLQYFQSNGFTLMKRSEVLGLISKNKFSICVAGSHGKTTVSAMIAHILTDSGKGCSAFLGGIATNYGTNYLQYDNDIVVIEADEYDRSFHRLSPEMAVITAVDTDHLDIYGSKENIEEAFLEFSQKIVEEGFLVVKEGMAINDRLPAIDKAFYGLHDTNADVYCSKYWVVDGGYLFNLMYYGVEYKAIRLNLGGFHNIENAIAAFAIAMELKVEFPAIKKAIGTFKGIKRRFELIYNSPNRVYIDDYAHHPEEIRVLLESIKEIYPDGKVTAIFQPHLFSRTKDLAAEFAKQLSLVDKLILLPIYPARELPMEGVTSDLILEKVTSASKQIVIKDEVLNLLRQRLEDNKLEVIVTIGAGDIDTLIQPIKELLAQSK